MKGVLQASFIFVFPFAGQARGGAVEDVRKDEQTEQYSRELTLSNVPLTVYSMFARGPNGWAISHLHRQDGPHSSGHAPTATRMRAHSLRGESS